MRDTPRQVTSATAVPGSAHLESLPSPKAMETQEARLLFDMSFTQEVFEELSTLLPSLPHHQPRLSGQDHSTPSSGSAGVSPHHSFSEPAIFLSVCVECVELACTSNTFSGFYALALLHQLKGSLPNGACLSPIIHHICHIPSKEVTSQPSPSTSEPPIDGQEDTYLPDALMMAELIQYSAPLPADLVVSCRNIEQSRRPTTGDIIKLHRVYTSSNPPSSSYLQSEVILKALLEDAFSPTRQKSLLQEKFWLLAYASTTPSSMTGVDPAAVKRSHASCLANIQKMDALTTRVVSMSQMQKEFNLFLSLLDDSICCMVILHWLKRVLIDPDFYAWMTISGEGVVKRAKPAAFCLLDEMAIRNPNHHSHIFSIYTTLYAHNFSSSITTTGSSGHRIMGADQGQQSSVRLYALVNMKQRFLDQCLFLVRVGYTLPVFTWILERAVDMDELLISYFLARLLQMVQAPYSLDVIDICCSLMNHLTPEISRSGLETFPLMTAFVQGALGQPRLPRNLQRHLADLSELFLGVQV